MTARDGLLVAMLAAILATTGTVVVWSRGIVPALGPTWIVDGQRVAARGLRCGDSVRGNSGAPGPAVLSSRHYERWACFPALADLDRAPEERWELVVPEGKEATITLRTNADLAVAAMSGPRRVVGPEPPDACDLRLGAGDLEIGGAGRWLVVVDGRDASWGPYRLDVECR